MTDCSDNFKTAVLTKIKSLKYQEPGSLAIDCIHGKIKYQLELLTFKCAKDPQMMDLLGRWRKENEMWYLSQFPVSVERTTKWFVEKLTEIPDRMLFIIKVPDGYVGHVGLFRFNFEKRACEIDNILRGESSCPGIIGEAIKTMMKWGREDLGLKGYALKVLSDNEKAIRLYERLGFGEIARIPLIQAWGKDGLEWQEAPEGYAGEAKRYYVEMELNQEEFVLQTEKKS